MVTNSMRNLIAIVEAAESGCPLATQDLELNTNTSQKAAEKSLCENCAAFDISPRMLECMPGELEDEDGYLGYCWMHKFKCHSARTCRTWAAGGPITSDEKSLTWDKD